MTSLAVRLLANGEAFDLTPWASNISYASVDPGGFGSVTFDLSRDVNAAEFPVGAEIAVYDGDDGEQVGGGRLLNPGRGIDPNSGDGVWKVSALGEGLAHAQERKQPHIIVDSRLDAWRNGASTSENRSWAVGAPPKDSEQNNTGLVFVIDQASVGDNAFSNANYYDMEAFGAEIGGVNFHDREGRTDSTNSQLEFQLRDPTGGGSHTDIRVVGWNTAGHNTDMEAGTDWTDDPSQPFTRFNLVYVRRNTADTTNDNQTQWILVDRATMHAVRLDRDGNRIIGGGAYSKGYVTADEAVTDYLARFCPRFDLKHARIDAGSYQHQNLVWPDGINAYDLFAFLTDLEPAFTWAAWERQANGLYRFEWRARDTEVRYEIPDVDAFELTGGQDERLIRLFYTGQSTAGHYKRVMAETSDFTIVGDFSGDPYKEALAAQGIEPTDTRQISVDGAEGWDWEDQAYAKATADLEASRYRATAAQATVSRGVFDHYTGRWIPARKMRAGYLCRIPNVRSGLDTLNDGQSEGAARFRIASANYSQQSNDTRLDLNTYTRDETRAIADLLHATQGV